MRNTFRAVFLDRDGVINRYPGDKKYVTSLKGFRFLPLAKAAIRRLHKAGMKIFVASNQAGVGRGIFSQDALDAVTRHMLGEISRSGGKIDEVFYCTHRKESNCPCRKPKTGLIELARNKYSIDLKRSFFIGDTIRDIITAKNAGCKAILVFSGKEKQNNRKNWETQPDFTFKNLWKAAEFILRDRI